MDEKVLPADANVSLYLSSPDVWKYEKGRFTLATDSSKWQIWESRKDKNFVEWNSTKLSHPMIKLSKIILSDQFLKLRTQIYTFGVIFVAVKYLPVREITVIGGTKITLDDKLPVEGALVCIVLFSLISAILCLTRDSIQTDLTYRPPNLSEAKEESRLAKMPSPSIQRNMDRMDVLDIVTNALEALFPIVFGSTIVILGCNTIKYFFTFM